MASLKRVSDALSAKLAAAESQKMAPSARSERQRRLMLAREIARTERPKPVGTGDVPMPEPVSSAVTPDVPSQPSEVEAVKPAAPVAADSGKFVSVEQQILAAAAAAISTAVSRVDAAHTEQETTAALVVTPVEAVAPAKPVAPSVEPVAPDEPAETARPVTPAEVPTPVATRERPESATVATLVEPDTENHAKQEQGARKRRKWPWLAVAAVALAGGYVGTAAAVGDTVPKGTTVAGVDISGEKPAAAVSKLDKALTPKAEQPFEVTLADSDNVIAIDPVDYELAVDSTATVEKVTGFNLSPASLAAHLFGGSALDPVVSFDENKLALVVHNLQSQLEGGYVDATIAFDGARPKVVPSSDGLGFAPEATEYALTVEALDAEGPLKLAATTVPPQVTNEEAAEALEKYAKPLVAGPVTMIFKGERIEASPEALGEAAAFPPVDGVPILTLDGAKLAQVILDTEPEGVVYGEDARITIVDHERVEIVPSTQGIGIDESKLATDVAAAIMTPERTVTARTAVSQARFTTEDAEALGVKEIVSEIDTPLTWEYVRTLNLQQGAAKVTGTLVKPGETFSLLTRLGPIDTAHGFYNAGMIIGGKHKDGVGGGLSQMSTNTFNLGFRAGYEDIEHHPHSYYFDRYPMGAESTLAVPTLDMRWRNNTPYGAVIDTWVADGYVHSRLWSTKYWDVTIDTSEPSNIVYSGWNTVVSNDCEYTPRGNNGFTVTVTRTVKREGEKPLVETNTVTYQPDYGTRCVAPPPPETPSPEPSPSSEEPAPSDNAST